MRDRPRDIWPALIAWGPLLTAAAVLLPLAAALGPRGLAVPPPWTVAVLALLAVLTDCISVPLAAGGYVSLAALVLMPAIVVLGPVPASLAGAFGVAVGDTIRGRGWQTRMFNVGQRALTVLLAGFAWIALLPGRPSAGAPLQAGHGAGLLPAGVAAVLAYSASQVLLVNARVAARRGERMRDLLARDGMWQATVSAALGASGIALLLLVTGRLTQGGLDALFLLLIASVAGLLFTMRQHAVREATAFQGAVGDLLGTLELGDLLGRLADRITAAARPDILWIALRGAGGGYAIALARGVSAERLTSLAGGIFPRAADEVLEHRRSVVIPDYARDPRRRRDIEGILGRRAGSVLIAPVVAGSEPLGVVTLVKSATAYFTPPQERLIATLAALAGLAMNNARLYETTRRTVAGLEALQRVARAAAAGEETAAIQQRIVDLATETLGAPRGILAHYDGASGTLIVAAYRNLPADALAWQPAVGAADWRTWTIVEAIRRAAPVATADTLELPGAPPVLPRDASRAVLAAPMLAQDRVVGAVAVGREDAHVWTPEEIELLQALANEGAVAIDNARLSQATRVQLQRMTALETISERINSQSDVNAVFDLIMKSARDVLDADRCGVFIGEPGALPSHVFARGLPEHYVALVSRTVASPLSAASLVMARRAPLVITDVLTDPIAEPVREAAMKVGYRTVALFPLLYQERVIGVLRLYHDRVRPYSKADIDLGAAFANQAALAVENTRLLNDAKRRAQELALLNRVVARVTSALRSEELFETLVEELHTTLHYPLVALLTVTEDRTALRMVSRRGYPGDVPDLIPLERGLVGRAARTGVPVLVEDVASQPEYLAIDPRVRQEACVPIFVDGRVAGVINIEATEPVLGRSDVELLTALANELSAALRNAALFAQVQAAHEELQALHDAAQAFSASLELSTVLESLVSVTCRRFGYDHSAILLADDGGDLEVRAACGPGRAVGTRVRAGDGPEGRAVRKCRAVLEASPRDGACGILAVPLVREGQAIGVFSVGAEDPGRLGERGQRTLTTLAGYAMVAIDNARLYEQTRRLASTDGLTGLANHRAFIQALDQELERARRYALPVSMIMIEIDRFKRYNDMYGHLRGDDVLRTVARALEQAHRKHIDLIARYGGDEFIILLPHTPRPVAADIAERVRRAIEDTPFAVGKDTTTITVSLGVAAFPDDGDNTIALVEAADRSMYAAKQAGGNAVATAAP